MATLKKFHVFSFDSHATLKNKINQLAEAVNELLDQSKPDPEYKVPLSGDPEYNKKVSEAEKSTAQLDFEDQHRGKPDEKGEDEPIFSMKLVLEKSILQIGGIGGFTRDMNKKQACQLLNEISVLVNQMDEKEPEIHDGTHRTSRWENRKKR